MNRQVFNIVLVHVSRTWERLRLTQPFQEMPFDNVGSVEEIEHIASVIYHDRAIQGFLSAPDDLSKDRWWIDNTLHGMSDTYIEIEAERIINQDYLG